MNGKFVRQAARACAVASLALISVFSATVAQSASFTFSDSNCASLNLIPNGGGSFTLQCSSISCPIQASASNALPGNPITLTAQCQGADGNQTYAWTLMGGGDPSCPQVNNGGSPTANPIQETDGTATTTSCTYKVTVTDGALGGATATQALTWTTAPPPPPTGCQLNTITTLPNPLTSAGGTATPVVTNCSPSTGLTYSWTQNGVLQSSMTTSNPTASLGANSGSSAIVYTFIPTICTGPATASCLTIAGGITATVPGSGGGGNIVCSGYTTTHVLPITWSTGGIGGASNWYSSNVGGFGKTDALVISFTTPAGTNANSMGNLSVSEYGGSPASRWSKGFSLSSCDFTGNVYDTQEPNFYFTVGSNGFGAPVLQPSTLYYVSVHNGADCGGSCNVLVTLQKPQGL